MSKPNESNNPVVPALLEASTAQFTHLMEGNERLRKLHESRTSAAVAEKIIAAGKLRRGETQ